MAVIKFEDLVKDAADRVERIKHQREVDRQNGITHFYNVNRRLELAERHVALLKLYQRQAGQLDLYVENARLNNK